MNKLRNRYRVLLALLSGILLFLSFPKFDLGFLIWVAIVPLMIAVHGVRMRDVFLLGWLTGGVYSLVMTYWLFPLYPYANLPVIVLGVTALIGYLGVYVAVFAWLHRRVGSESPLAYVFSGAAIWTALEMVRGWGLLGYPWCTLGNSQYRFLTFAQIASITGMGGLTFIIASVNGAIAWVTLNRRNWRRAVPAFSIVAGLLIASLIYGAVQLNRPLKSDKRITIALIPGNLTQKEKIYGDMLHMFNDYLDDIDRTLHEKPDLIVLPETFIITDLLRRPSYMAVLRQRLEQTGGNLLFGTGHSRTEGDRQRSYNTAVLISADGVVATYFKQRRVPFGEYTPFSEYLPKSLYDRIAGVADWDAGKESTVMTLNNGGRFGTVICFESVFPYIWRDFVRNGVDFMGIITNDAWFNGMAAAYQHFSLAIFRAIETRRSVFRCANRGVSAVIDPKGRIISGVAYPEEKEIIIAELPFNSGTTIYVRFGEWLPILCSLYSLALIAFAIFRRFRRFNRASAPGEVNE